MAKTSSIDTLPKAIKERLNFLLANDATATLDSLVAWLDEQGHPRSRSAVGRHRQKVAAASKALGESREVIKALGAELGALPEGQYGRFLVEMVRKMAFDRFMEKLEAGEAIDHEEFFMFSKGLKELAAANRYDQDFEIKVRQAAADEAKKEAAQVAETAASEAGASEEQVAFIRARILGIQDRVSRAGVAGSPNDTGHCPDG